MLIAACSNNSNATNEKPLANNAQANVQQEIINASSSSDESIVGEWKLLYWVKDKNENKQLEDEERKDPIAGAEDYMKLNSDGSCLCLVFKQKGRYEVNTNSDGKKMFTLIDVNNNRAPKGHIYSVTKDEFILLDGLIFRVYKRI